jgi:hypothetical protein
MTSPSFGNFPPQVQCAFAIVDTTPSESHPDGRVVVNVGGVLSNYTKVSGGEYTFDLIFAAGKASVDNLGVHVTPTSDTSGSEDANFGSYTIDDGVTPSKLHVFTFDAAGSKRDVNAITITLFGSPAGSPA